MAIVVKLFLQQELLGKSTNSFAWMLFKLSKEFLTATCSFYRQLSFPDTKNFLSYRCIPDVSLSFSLPSSSLGSLLFLLLLRLRIILNFLLHYLLQKLLRLINPPHPLERKRPRSLGT